MDWINDMNKFLGERRAKYQESIHSGEAAKRVRKAVSIIRNSAVSQETRSKAGKKGGAKTAKSFTRESQIKAVKSRTQEGIAKSVKKATAASNIIKKEKTELYKKKLYDLITLDEFTIKDIEHLYTEFDNLKDTQMIRIWVKDTQYFTPLGRRGLARLYKKI